MIAEIICVGTELLLGDILNTNAQYLSRRLAELGVSVYYQSVVGDNEERLIDLINTAKTRSEFIIFSGGLGPTSDDITKETVAKALNLNLYEDKTEAEKLKAFFASRTLVMTENNLKQVLIPEGATILINNNGTAPGVLMEQEGNTFVILPGPPNELVPMFEESVVPYVKNKSKDNIVSKTLRMVGIGESTAASIIQDIIDTQTNPSIAPYAKLAEVHFRITAKADSIEVADKMIQVYEEKVRERLGEYIYTTQPKELEEVIVDLLIQKGKTIATAESCTGGLVASTLINCSGVSGTFLQGAITYSNASKMIELGVSKDTLEQYGAVSEQVAIEMAQGICKKAQTDIGLSVTGIAGPTGGGGDKPVGLVYIAVAIGDEVCVKKIVLSGNRSKIRTGAAKNALIFLYQQLKL